MDSKSPAQSRSGEYSSNDGPERVSDINIIWNYLRKWNENEKYDATTLVQDIVEIRHSDDDKILRELCEDSPILDDEIYAWLLNDRLFIDMQSYRKEIERAESLMMHHEAVRILMQLQAYLRHNPAVSEDIERIFKRISTTT